MENTVIFSMIPVLDSSIGQVVAVQYLLYNCFRKREWLLNYTSTLLNVWICMYHPKIGNVMGYPGVFKGVSVKKSEISRWLVSPAWMALKKFWTY